MFILFHAIGTNPNYLTAFPSARRWMASSSQPHKVGKWVSTHLSVRYDLFGTRILVEKGTTLTEDVLCQRAQWQVAELCHLFTMTTRVLETAATFAQPSPGATVDTTSPLWHLALPLTQTSGNCMATDLGSDLWVPGHLCFLELRKCTMASCTDPRHFLLLWLHICSEACPTTFDRRRGRIPVW